MGDQQASLTGVCPVIATPFTHDEEIDYPSLRNEIRTTAAGGVHGLVLFGFATEFYKLEDEEMIEMIRVAVEECDRADVPLYVSITQHATTVAVRWAQRAERMGVDGIMLLPPFLIPPSATDLHHHMRQVAEAVSIPVVIQYAPEETGVTIEPEVFARLSEEVENVRSYKIECTPPGGYITQLLEATDGAVDVLVGKAGRQMIDAMDRGAVGVMPGPSLHEVYLQIYEHHRAGRRERALEIHDRLVPLLDYMGGSAEMFFYYEKQLLKRRGMIETGVCRRPTFEPDDNYDRLIDDSFEKLRPFLDE